MELKGKKTKKQKMELKELLSSKSNSSFIKIKEETMHSNSVLITVKAFVTPANESLNLRIVYSQCS